MTTALSLEEVKTRQQKTWSSGDYGKVAWITVPLAEALCDAVGLRPGSAVLDVATGTGHVALAAARRFCAVTGVDYVPALLQEARARAGAEHLQVQFREGDAEELPCADGSFDYVLSAIGVMFTADHQRAAEELLRVCRSGGVVGLANWTPAGFIGQMLSWSGAMPRHRPVSARCPAADQVGDRGRDPRPARRRHSRAGLHHGQRDAAFPVAGVLR
jgi:SAM-dependent methyltransferase